MTFSSIDPREMHHLGHGVQSAGKSLTECAGQLRAILNQVDLTHPGITAISQVGEWLTDQASDLYRRRDLAYEAEKVDVDVFGHPLPGMVVPPGKTRIDESRMIPASVRAEASQAAALVEAAARGDEGAAEKLRAYRDKMSDPQFATALVEHLGPRGLFTIPAVMGTQVRKTLDADRTSAEALRQRNRDVLTMLSRALATATDTRNKAHVTRKFIGDLQRDGRAEIPAPDMGGLTNPGYWSLGQILAAAPDQTFSTHFMRTVGRDMIRWDREYLQQRGTRFLPKDTDVYNLPAPSDTRPFQETDAVGAADPIAALMTVAGRSREPAQALLEDRDLLKYLLTDRRPQWQLGDRGESLGEAMEAAMAGQDRDSKELAALASQFLADTVKPHVSWNDDVIEISNPSELDRLSGIRDNMGRILAEHIDDIVQAYYRPMGRDSEGRLTNKVDGRHLARFSAQDLDYVLLDVSVDDRAYKALLLGQIAYMRGKVDLAIAGRNGRALNNWVASTSRSVGHLLEARRLALVGRGKEADAANAAFREWVQNGIGLIPIPFAGQVGKTGIKVVEAAYENFVKDGYVQAGNWLVDQTGRTGGRAAEAAGTASDDYIAAQGLVRQMLESSYVAQGYYDHKDLRGQNFAVGDPPRVKLPHLMNSEEYDNFVNWLHEHTDVPDKYAKAQSTIVTGATEFSHSVGKPAPAQQGAKGEHGD